MEVSALVITGATSSKTLVYQHKSDEKPHVWCDYCDKPRHTYETCWRLHKKPTNWKSKAGEKTGRSFPTANEAEASPFTKEQIVHLLMLLKSGSSSSDSPNASMAHIGNKSKALSCCINSSAPWIIDSRASDHMTNSFKLFQSYTPCLGNRKVKITDGSFSTIAGKGLIQISEKINMKSVLHVPKLTCNLLSVSKLSKDSN